MTDPSVADAAPPDPLPPSADAPAWKALFPEPVAVLGYGVEGRSTVQHLRRRGYRDLVVLDRQQPSDTLPDGVRGVFGAHHLDALAGEGIRTVFRAPGVRPFVREIDAFRARGGLLTSQVEAVFALLGRARIAGVTGTVGKGTCCSLLSAMLTEAGIPHRLAGNIGVPPLDALADFTNGTLPPDAVLVLELSSFQLCTLRESPRVAVVLRTTTEHLDWHADRAEYWDHKANLVRFQQADDVVVSYDGVEGSRWMGGLGAGRRVSLRAAPSGVHSGDGSGDGVEHGAENGAVPAPDTAEDIIRLTAAEAVWTHRSFRLALADTHMTGAFNLENVAAAAAAAFALGASPEAVRAGARRFEPLEHRIEFVRAHGGIRYFNDSYATRPEAALAAVRAFRPPMDGLRPAPGDAPSPPLGLILGGSEKNADFTELAHALRDEPHVRAIAFIGHTAARLEGELEAAGALAGRASRRCASLEEALTWLRGEVREGIILLSPACASFGLFANYKERGKAFKRLVNALP